MTPYSLKTIRRQLILSVPVFAVILISVLTCCKQKTTLDSSPWHIQMVEAEMARNPEAWMFDFEKRPKWNYTHGLMLMAIERVWQQTGKQEYFDYIKGYYDEMIDEQGNILHNFKISNYNIDHIKPGINLFDLYEQTGDKRYLTALQTLREQLKTHPRIPEGGFWHKKIYPNQLWLDGVYMNTPFYARYGKVFNEPENFDDVVHQIVLVEQKTRDAATGLLYHAYDDSRQQAWSNPQTGHSPHFWGRAMGWYAMALVDVLDFLPTDHAGRTDVLQILNRLVEAITKVQDPETGLWYQVLDQMGREGNYLEASASCMFAYTMIKAVNNHYIDEQYKDKAAKAFQGILDNLISYNDEGHINLNQICGVAGLGGTPYRDGSYEYYINEIIRSNDPKGVGPFILLSLEMEKANLTFTKKNTK